MLLDEIDKIILSHLGRNARITSLQITTKLHDLGFDMTDRAIRHRLRRLENSKVILGYSAILNPEFVSARVNRTVMMKFRNSENSEKTLERLKKYLAEAPFCVYYASLSGDFDLICHFVFDSLDQYELEISNFLHGFSRLFADFRTYESKALKLFPYTVLDEHDLNQRRWQVFKILNSLNEYDNLNDKLKAIANNLVKYFDATFAQIWLLDKERKKLVLKFSAGKSKGNNDEFLKQPIMDQDIILRTMKPAITNDILNDPRTRHHHKWAATERLKSSASYPLIYNDQVIGALTLVSKKKLRTTDFELLGIFSDHISKQVSMFFDTMKRLT
jgi:DNA-binding Lrp family transcriptional regulator